MKEKKHHITQNSGNDEWYTPTNIIDAAKNTMGSIDLDPASSAIANQTVMSKNYYTKEDDGLKQQLYGNIWLNPPYSRSLISQFSFTVINKRNDYDQAIVLVNNATETRWFQILLRNCSAFCVFNRRIKFLGVNGETGGSSLQGQIIFYFGPNLLKFEESFSTFGILCNPISVPSEIYHTALPTINRTDYLSPLNSECAA